MDSQRFDTLVKAVFSPGTRRSIVRQFSVLPLGLTFAALLGSPHVTAEDDDHGSSHRRRRRRTRHKHRRNTDRHQNKNKPNPQGPPRCTPESVAQACAGQVCGTAVNNCGQTVQCTGCPGCCAGTTCQTGDSDTACGARGAACSNCAVSSKFCTGTGVCATACTIQADCPPGCGCGVNVSGAGPANTCGAAGAGQCAPNDCADCEALGMGCYGSDPVSCNPVIVCVPPC
jgi:hypothetical protein